MGLGPLQCHKEVPEIKILKFMIKYYNYYSANTLGHDSAKRQELFYSSSIELKQKFYLDKLTALKAIDLTLSLKSEESKEEEDMVHYHIYYEYLKNFKDQESLIFSIQFFSKFIKTDTQVNVSALLSL